MYRKLIIIAGVLGIGILLSNALANKLYLYVSIPWFDMVMHGLGGVFIAVTVGALLINNSYRPREQLVMILLAVFIIGLGWEYYEYLVQFFVKAVDLAKIPDSISDLICDMIGGTLGATFVILLQKRYNR